MVRPFAEVISTRAALRSLVGEPVHPLVVAKTLRALDRHCRAFINASPFVLVGTADRAGRMDISPKGDPAGFVQVLDDTTLAIPERPGNQRCDSFENLIENPRVAVIFLIPGKRETLRVSGAGRIVTDPDLLATMAVHGKAPLLATIVDVEEAFMHCAKSMVRSHLWQPAEWPSLDGLPSLAEAMRDATRADIAVEMMQALISEDEAARLY
jgi:PPOX class probable FMN-dependent enzyme